MSAGKRSESGIGAPGGKPAPEERLLAPLLVELEELKSRLRSAEEQLRRAKSEIPEPQSSPAAAGAGGPEDQSRPEALAERAVRDSEYHFRLLSEAVPCGLWVCNAHGGMEYVSQCLLDLVGTTLEEVREFGWTHRLIKEDAQAFTEGWLGCVETGSDWDAECRFKAKDGTVRTILTRGRPVRDQAGAIKCWVGVCLDITDRKQAEEQLQNRTEQLRLAQIAAHAGAWQWEIAAGRITWSPECCLLFGTDPQHPPTTVAEWYVLIAPEDRPAARAAMRHATRHGGDFDLEFRVRHPLHGVRWLNTRGRVTLDHGRPTGVVGIALDITERKEAELKLAEQARELARSNAELEQFASIIAHDLRSPLVAISGSAQFLAEELGANTSAGVQESLGYLRQSVGRLNRLIGGLLEYSRLGQGRPNVAKCDSGVLFDHVVRDLQPLVGDGGQVTCAALPTIRADESQLRQVLQNLIENALKYRGDKPPIVQVFARREGPYWVFCVRDNGMGIPREQFGRIFQIFRRLHTDESRYGGLGIGLATCKRIVERHGGRIWVDSQLGEGSTFFFSLPA